MAKKTETGLTKNPRAGLLVALEDLKNQLAAHKKVTESPLKTNGQFKWNLHNTQSINIQECKDLRLLISILGYIKHQEMRYDEAAKELGLAKVPAFEWCKYTYKDWLHDIKVRATVITSEQELKRIEESKAKLEKFLTEEDQLAQTLAELGYGDAMASNDTEDQTETAH